MKKNLLPVFSLLFFSAIIGLYYLSQMPHWTSDENVPLSEFSTKRALTHIKAISQKPHYTGSENHNKVADYLHHELNKLGLETEFQEGYTLTDWGNLVKSKNIIAKISGTRNGKALVLLSHYDSAPHSFSYGASDAGSGVATILESVRTFLYNNAKHKNDIIILFTDAEELGLNGAALFVTQHQWAKEVGLVLNFEARGTSGPSYLLMETNGGNAGLVDGFSEAGPLFPVANSLMYSVYKTMPNDTDLTVFREKGDIQGFNFAFIDGHYNYHTVQDDINHLDINSVAHQGTYLMPLLDYFSNADLNSTKAAEDFVYFTVPFSFISYPFSWVTPMLIVAIVLFIFFVFLGIAKRILNVQNMIKGFVPLLGSVLLSGLITFLGWRTLLEVYPQYDDLLNGFTYNGHYYIAAFVLLSLSITFAFYNRYSAWRLTLDHYVSIMFIWLLINGVIAFNLKGAGFLIIPLYFGIFSFAYYIITQQYRPVLYLIFGIPALLIIVPFIYMFPIGLGLKILYGSAILTALTFGLLLPIFASFTKKGYWSLFFSVLSIGFFIKAHQESDYAKGKAKSNSLVYFYDVDNNTTHWVTYDKNLDFWTKEYLGKTPKAAEVLNENPLFSKYGSHFTYAAVAPKKAVPRPDIEFLTDSIANHKRYLKIRISPKRKVNRYDIFANEKMEFYNLKTNGVSHIDQKGDKFARNGKKLLSYYVADNEPLEMQFDIERSTILDMVLLESSFDLMENPLFNMNKRADWMMPTPFVLTDAVIVKKRINPGIRVITVTDPKLLKKKPTPTILDNILSE